MGRQKGYTDENGEWHDYMSKAEVKAHAEDCGKFVAFMKEKCVYCNKPLSKEKGELDHGCLDCHGYVFLQKDGSYLCEHCGGTEPSSFYRKKIAEMNKKYPLHDWQGSAMTPLSCKKCGMSAITPWGECRKLERKKK